MQALPGGVCFEESYNGSKKYSIILIIVSAVLGALLIAFPDKMIQYTALFIGGAFVACGVYAILSYIINKKYVFTLTLGIISAVAGVVVCCAYRQIITVIIFYSAYIFWWADYLILLMLFGF